MQSFFHDIFTGRFSHPCRHRAAVVIFFVLLASLPSLADQNPNAAMEKSSEKLFLEARSSFEDKDYWDAARDLIILIDFNANYSRTDEVLFLLGECLYEIGLQNSAAKLYRHLLTKYLRSPFLPRAMLGLQRTEYDRKDFARCIEYHNAISRSNAPRPVMDASYYFAGLSYYTVRDFPRAIDLLDKLSSKSPYYEYGQYTLALSYLRMKNVRKAINTFKDICTLTIESDERRNIVDETHLTLGYLYYELGFYEQAGEHFRNVSSNHAHYDAALLAAGWSSIQLGDQLQAITPLTSLVTLYPEKENTEEALFLLGHCYLKLQIYDGALKVYDQLISMFPNRDIIPAIIEEVQSNLLDESITIEKMKTELLVLESNFLDALPLNEADGAVPEHLKEERALLIEARQNLMARIQEERKKFEELTYKMELLQQMTKRRQSRRDWRAFAEYGKSRVLFLQSLQ